MINLFVVEGDDDIRFLKDILYIEFLNHSINIIPVPYHHLEIILLKNILKPLMQAKIVIMSW